jgi:membrane protein DedA with SNARE-associated domain
MKKSLLYLGTSLIGVVLIIIGIVLLVDAIKRNDHSETGIRILVLLLLIFLTISNYLLYKREKVKNGDR